MKLIRQFVRLIHIHYVFAKHGLDTIVLSLPWFRAFHFMIYGNPWNWFREVPHRGEAIRMCLEELGPIFIKFGQAMSTRPDILPLDIAEELTKLQDKIPPFPSIEAVNKIEKTLGGTIDVLFSEFEMTPLASASIAQVHAAKLLNGKEVVVKVVRPDIRRRICEDLALMKRVARLIERYHPSLAQRLRPLAIVEEFETHLLDELDLQREGANAAQLKRNFHDSLLLYVPEVIWEYTKAEVLVMERIKGIPVSDIKRLKQAGINIPKLAERGVEIFFTQVFRDSFFHADMHPGNIFVSEHHPDSPSYICVDFGLMGSLSESDQRYLAYNLYAFFNRDYRRVAELHIESGWVARGTRVEEFESAIRTVCEPIFERPLYDISLAKLVLSLFQVAKRFQMEVQPQLLLLQKTLLAVEGLGRQLYPELDLWVTAKPFLERFLKNKLGPKAFLKHMKTQLPFFTEQLPYLPRLMYDVLILNKAQYEWQLEQRKHQRALVHKRASLSIGMSVGMLALAALASGLVFFDVLPQRLFGVILSTIGITSVVMMAVVYFSRRRKWD